MKFEFHRPEEADQVLATATWTRGHVEVDSNDEPLRLSIEHAFRPTPVLVDDGAYRTLGTHGPVIIEPGDLEWFRAVGQVRVPMETGLVGRLVPEIREGGYDPAADYRPFEESIERLASARS